MRSEPVRYLSQPAAVSMDDRWYEIANLDHPWIVRRFEVLRRLAGDLIAQSPAIAEIGCGHGLLQRQIEDFYQFAVTGFDLNETALKQTASRVSPVCCYDVHEKNIDYQAQFSLILLADVLEHIADQDAFLRAVKFHLAHGGSVLENVPALQSLYSGYDRAVGHLRRYRIASLAALARRNEMTITRYTYWGLPLLPLLILRKLWMLGRSGEQTIAAGFETGGPLRDRLMLWLSRCEPIPQGLIGTSLMAVLRSAA
jgi:SAM-dependent methyltransferase